MSVKYLSPKASQILLYNLILPTFPGFPPVEKTTSTDELWWTFSVGKSFEGHSRKAFQDATRMPVTKKCHYNGGTFDFDILFVCICLYVERFLWKYMLNIILHIFVQTYMNRKNGVNPSLPKKNGFLRDVDSPKSTDPWKHHFFQVIQLEPNDSTPPLSRVTTSRDSRPRLWRNGSNVKV